MKRLSLLLAISGLYVGCQQVPQLTDYRVMRDMAEYKSWVESVPIVIVGTVGANVPVDHPIKSHWDAQVELRLDRLDVHVESVLRGDLQVGAHLPVYYFHIYSTYNGPPPLGSWKVGDRELLYIRRDAGVLRLACDGWDHCTFPACTGAHFGFKADPKQPLDAALAEIFLTKGRGVSDADFADAVGRYGETIPRRGDTTLRQYTLPKLRILAASANPDIHKTACYVLKNSFNLPCETPTPQ